MPVVDERDRPSGILAVDDLLDSISTSLGDIVAMVAHGVRAEEEFAP